MYTKDARLLLARLGIVALLATFGLILTGSPSQAASTLRAAAAEKNIVIGTAVEPSLLSGETAYREIVAREFNSLTAENAMKWETVQPSRGSFNWSGGDAVVNFAAQNGQRVYGHTLVWHSQTPQWVQNLSAAELLPVMRTHIDTVVKHFGSSVDTWDVVNEVVGDNAAYRDSFWYQKLGASYIAEAFRAARAASPTAKLFINDYNIDGINAKSTMYYNMIRDLKAQGVPIDGIGFQAHLTVGGVPGDMRANLQRFADLGLDVRITELDIRMQTPPDATKLARQAADYAAVVNACLGVSRCRGITIWGFTDKYSWVPDVFPGQGAALIYDANYQAKPAYQSTLTALGGTPGPGPDPDPDPGPCKVTYRTNDWQGGFTGAVTVANTGTASITAWSLVWTFPSGQSVSQGWNGTYTQSGTTVTVRNVAYNGTIAPGQSTQIGFNGTWTGVNTAPNAFTLNGTSCTVG
ncbi:endo-1,4-beta-xylanase [Phytomonospora sp. NPDC050363]|uniref:endo-1,4-beta-xylanase n=1 Tax=Phytomonospora sp. NPDC050363 TaxID=3155642 RepID=UPI0033E0EB56